MSNEEQKPVVVTFEKITMPKFSRKLKRRYLKRPWWKRLLGIGKVKEHDLRTVICGPPYPEELFREVAEHADEVHEQLKNEELKSKTNQ